MKQDNSSLSNHDNMPPLSNEPTSKASSAQANGDVTPTEQSEDTRFSPEEEAVRSLDSLSSAASASTRSL